MVLAGPPFMPPIFPGATASGSFFRSGKRRMRFLGESFSAMACSTNRSAF